MRLGVAALCHEVQQALSKGIRVVRLPRQDGAARCMATSPKRFRKKKKLLTELTKSDIDG